MKQIHIQCIRPDEELLLRPTESASRQEFSVKDDGRGNIDLKMGMKQVGWFNLNSGYLICDPGQVEAVDPTPEPTPSLPSGLPTPTKRS